MNKFIIKSAINKTKKDIHYHYDVPPDFYQLWLDKKMLYTCGYFVKPKDTIERAQVNKLELICKKLQLKPNDRVIDIGCGWGGFLIYAAKKYGVYVDGVTLSREQYDYSRALIKKHNLTKYCKVILKDYRELEVRDYYDKAVSIGMFEQVGEKFLDHYFHTVNKLLKDKGLFLNHGITCFNKTKNKTLGNKFIDKYVFPGAEIVTLSHVIKSMEKNRFEILDTESLRNHYPRTLRLWTRKLSENKTKALEIVSEKIFNIWNLYMSAMAVSFVEGTVSVYQVLGSKMSEKGLHKFDLIRKY